MIAPKRIQLRRTKGWRLPEGTINVARPGVWGNPFRVHTWCARCEDGTCPKTMGAVDDRQDAAISWAWQIRYPEAYAPHLPGVDDIRYGLRGKDLACWCPVGEACHGDLLLLIANTDGDDEWWRVFRGMYIGSPAHGFGWDHDAILGAVNQCLSVP